MRCRKLWVWAAVAVLTCATGCAGLSRPAPRGGAGEASGRAADASPPTGPAPQRTAAPSGGLPSVGVLLDADGHWCTASVVDSPRGNVVATAAHCVYGDEGAVRDVAFAPGFHGAGEGTAPYGTWRVRAVEVDRAWEQDADDARDYAFLTLEPDGRGREVQRVVGAAVPDWESGPRRRVTVVGYPNQDHNPANGPISCTTDTVPDPDLAGSMVMECAGFWDGTSGSPWLADQRDPKRPGRLIGVLSGGDTDTESTAVLFDARARELYTRAAAPAS
ncbi:trypsin-like serine peptidase [Streptomyces sp. SP18CS02]|uniref:trypsin-like serine peptidase n=1 Tax=Streptomyces sp. SP18CS02 TaxID=3002531 RepID=UPI002E799ED4|nr:trypsin-like serine protease [Streptomyces sp. SP18CS02]MEE1757242.1 trypsin-like serine protease [Streptomyces sp. SP18CS02]